MWDSFGEWQSGCGSPERYGHVKALEEVYSHAEALTRFSFEDLDEDVIEIIEHLRDAVNAVVIARAVRHG